jgi:RNA polymerase subunit RPABC4/transcription elongation factor Spt4
MAKVIKVCVDCSYTYNENLDQCPKCGSEEFDFEEISKDKKKKKTNKSGEI